MFVFLIFDKKWIFDLDYVYLWYYLLVGKFGFYFFEGSLLKEMESLKGFY